MFNLKGKNLFKLHNCIKCHNNKLKNFKKFFYPKIKGQYIDYLIWSIKQYQFNFFNKNYYRKNFIMTSQIQNLSFYDIKDILSSISNI